MEEHEHEQMAFIKCALLGRQFDVGNQPNAIERIMNGLSIWCQCFWAAVGLFCGIAGTEADVQVMHMDVM